MDAGSAAEECQTDADNHMTIRLDGTNEDEIGPLIGFRRGVRRRAAVKHEEPKSHQLAGHTYFQTLVSGERRRHAYTRIPIQLLFSCVCEGDSFGETGISRDTRREVN